MAAAPISTGFTITKNTGESNEDYSARPRYSDGGGILATGFRRAVAQTKLKVAGAHASPVENASWNLRLHDALKKAAAEGKIDYVFSEGIANSDYPRALRQYAEGGMQLIVGESDAVEREARQVAKDYPKTSFLMGCRQG